MGKFDVFNKTKKFLEMPGIEPGAFHMQSERSTTELHPLMIENICNVVTLSPLVLLFNKSI